MFFSGSFIPQVNAITDSLQSQNANIPGSSQSASNNDTLPVIPLQQHDNTNGLNYAPKERSYTINSTSDILKVNQDILKVGTRSDPGLCCPTPTCVLGSAVSTVTLWTPIILLNSPYGGSASGSSSQTVSGSYTFSAGAVSLQQSTSNQASNTLGPIYNGEADALAELDTWTIYSVHDVLVWGGMHPCTQSYVAQITNRLGDLQSYTIMPSGTASDRSEPTSFSMPCSGCSGQPTYSSVTFNNEFVQADNNPSNFGSCYGQGNTITVTQTSTASLSVSISFTISGNSYSTGGGLVIQASKSNTQSWQYQFPAYYGTWFLDNLEDNGQPAALAFDYQPCNFASSVYSDGTSGGGAYSNLNNLVGAPDGNVGELHASNCCSDASWVVLDMGTTYYSGTEFFIDAYSYNNGAGAYYSHVQIFVSPDGSSWTKVYDQTVNPSSSNNPIWMQIASISTSFRYVQIKALDDQGLSAALRVDAVGVT